MTYCLAMRLDDGLLFVSDTRTNAGVDNVSTHRKLHVFRPAEDRLFVVQSAGNLATTHGVLDQVAKDLEAPGDSLGTVDYLSDAAEYLGDLGVRVADRHRDALGAAASTTFILGGQVGPGRPDVLLVYPEGNYIRVSDERPFHQIGETKYGKAWLDLAVRAQADLGTAAKIALSSMIATATANLSVGPPYDIGWYLPGSYGLQHARIEEDSPLLARLSDAWREHMLAGVAAMPALEPGDLTLSPSEAPLLRDTL